MEIPINEKLQEICAGNARFRFQDAENTVIERGYVHIQFEEPSTPYKPEETQKIELRWKHAKIVGVQCGLDIAKGTIYYCSPDYHARVGPKSNLGFTIVFRNKHLTYRIPMPNKLGLPIYPNRAWDKTMPDLKLKGQGVDAVMKIDVEVWTEVGYDEFWRHKEQVIMGKNNPTVFRWSGFRGLHDIYSRKNSIFNILNPTLPEHPGTKRKRYSEPSHIHQSSDTFFQFKPRYKPINPAFEYKHQSSFKDIPERPELSPLYRVTDDFVGQKENEMSVRVGQLVTVEQRVEGWWYVRTKEGGAGWVPASHLEKLKDLPDREAPKFARDSVWGRR